MNRQNYEAKLASKFTQPANFIRNLYENGVELDHINTNDWQNCPNPKVYLGDRAYKRFSNYDLKNALNYYRRGN